MRKKYSVEFYHTFSPGLYGSLYREYGDMGDMEDVESQSLVDKLKANRWRVLGIVAGIIIVLAAGAAAQHQLMRSQQKTETATPAELIVFDETVDSIEFGDGPTGESLQIEDEQDKNLLRDLDDFVSIEFDPKETNAEEADLFNDLENVNFDLDGIINNAFPEFVPVAVTNPSESSSIGDGEEFVVVIPGGPIESVQSSQNSIGESSNKNKVLDVNDGFVIDDGPSLTLDEIGVALEDTKPPDSNEIK
ncbi:unnamed protein product, partial [Meganyctiphanes norvegica]